LFAFGTFWSYKRYNFEIGKKCLKLSFEMGHKDSGYELAYIFSTNNDYIESMKWYKKQKS